MKIGRLFKTATAAIAALCFFFFLASAHSQNRPPVAIVHLPQPSTDEKLLLDDLNRERAAAGVQPLKWNDALAAAALEHARVMVRENVLTHQAPGELPLEQRAAQAHARFSVIEENVAVGPDAPSIHDGLMHSPGHRKNILNPAVTAVGIAAVRGADGLFAVEDFSRPVAELSLQQQEEEVVSLLRKMGVPRASAGEDARKTCMMKQGYEGGSVRYVVRFDVPDLSALPDELTQKIKVGGYRNAEVGACRGSDSAGFAAFRIAVLFQ